MRDIASSILIVLGNILVLSNGSHRSHSVTFNELPNLISSPSFIIYIAAAYSIALLLHKLKAAGILGGANLSSFEITGFDISPGTLFLASAGRYSQLEISRGLPEYWKNNFFDSTPGNTWTLKPEIRSMVTFKKRNLQDDLSNLGLFDLVLCRNVAIYFEEDFKKDLFTRLAQVILPNGHLMLGGTESLFTHQHLYSAENVAGSFFYRRK